MRPLVEGHLGGGELTDLTGQDAGASVVRYLRCQPSAAEGPELPLTTSRGVNSRCP